MIAASVGTEPKLREPRLHLGRNAASGILDHDLQPVAKIRDNHTDAPGARELYGIVDQPPDDDPNAVGVDFQGGRIDFRACGVVRSN